jgi:L-serine dehydratase
MTTGLFEIFKIGIGPSSSHTVGPTVAARRFLLKMEKARQLDAVDRLRIDLYGSLALTGAGPGTLRAAIHGLCGAEPHSVDPRQVDLQLERIRERGSLELLGEDPIPFKESEGLRLHCDESLPFHPNGMTFTALNFEGDIIPSEAFSSIGGGSVVPVEGLPQDRPSDRVLFLFRSAAELLGLCRQTGLRIWQLVIWQLVLRNECA